MNAETCFTPKSFLLALKFIEYDQIIYPLPEGVPGVE